MAIGNVFQITFDSNGSITQVEVVEQNKNTDGTTNPPENTGRNMSGSAENDMPRDMEDGGIPGDTGGDEPGGMGDDMPENGGRSGSGEVN